MIQRSELPETWWGSFKFTNGQIRQWRIGPLTLLVRCLSDEWQIAYERLDHMDDLNEFNTSWQSVITDALPESLKTNSRYFFQKTSGQLAVTPLLADRPVITRPRIPFNLTAGEKVTLYVSSPLCLDLSVGNPPKHLNEVAIQRPSDTWFGPSTREGELCYASTTHCHVNLEELPQRPHRAITPVTIRNQADTTLSLERLSLPVPYLSLYSSANGQLWTPGITLNREEDGDMADLKIGNKPPKSVNNAVRLSNARNTNNDGLLIRAFNAVFS